MGKEQNFGTMINTNGLDKNPDNINKDGRPTSIRTELKELLQANGTITFDKGSIQSINDDGSVTLKVAESQSLALKLIDWAMSKKGNESIKAIQMIMDQVDGKPIQTNNIGFKEQPLFVDIPVISWANTNPVD